MEFDYSIIDPEQFEGVLPTLGFVKGFQAFKDLVRWEHPKFKNTRDPKCFCVPSLRKTGEGKLQKALKKQYAEIVYSAVEYISAITNLSRLEILQKLLCYPIPDPELGKRSICTLALTVAYNGFRYIVPAWIACQDRDRFFKKNEEDTWKSIMEGHLNAWIVVSWAQDRMAWKNFKPYSILIETPVLPSDLEMKRAWLRLPSDGGLDWLPESE